MRHDVEGPLNRNLLLQAVPAVVLSQSGVDEEHHSVRLEQFLPESWSDGGDRDFLDLTVLVTVEVILYDPGVLSEALLVPGLPLPGTAGDLVLVEAPLCWQVLVGAAQKTVEEMVTETQH